MSEEEQKKLREGVEDLVEEKKETLLGFWKNLRLNELYNTIEKNYGKTAHTVLFTGWVPRLQQRSLDGTIRNACNNACYIEWNRPEEAVGIKGLEAPVQFKNPRVLRPFQMLVENYAIPEYGTFDPTPMVAVAYLIMFGLMFGDAGHGAALVVAGIIGSIVKRDKPIKRLFQLIIWCGASAIVFGVLFGSYFGMEWAPPIWFDFHGAVTGHATGGFVQDIYGILALTIYFGIGVIGIGLLINWANCIRKRRWVRLVLDKTGILGGWMYGAGVYTAFYFGKHDFKQLPPGSLLFWILGVPAILLFLKPVVDFIIEHRRHGKRFSGFTVVDFIMEWIVEMLEVFSGYLSNTLSFMRVAGLGIAHVSLMTAFFQIGRMIGGGSYNAGSYFVLLFGNLLVIALEGLSAGIQSLRLNYYEFFSKYFSGSGIAYTPVSLKRPQFGGLNEKSGKTIQTKNRYQYSHHDRRYAHVRDSKCNQCLLTRGRKRDGDAGSADKPGPGNEMGTYRSGHSFRVRSDRSRHRHWKCRRGCNGLHRREAGNCKSSFDFYRPGGRTCGFRFYYRIDDPGKGIGAVFHYRR